MSEIALKIVPESPPGGPGGSPTPNAWNARLLLAFRWVTNCAAFLISDALALLLAFYSAGIIRHLVKGGSMFPEWTLWFVVVWSILSLATRLSPGWGLNAIEEIKHLTLLLVSIFAGLTSILFLSKLADSASRLTLGLAFLLSLCFIPVSRKCVKWLLIRCRLWGMQVVIYGNRESAKELISILQHSVTTGYIPVAVYLTDERTDTLEGVPALDWQHDPYEFAETAMIIDPKTIQADQPHFIEEKLQQYRRVMQIPEVTHDAPTLWTTTRDLGGVLGMEISSNLLDTPSRILKIVFDLFAILIMAPLMLPAVALIALLVWLQDFHSPLFLQERIGRSGKAFKMWKFRTMRPHAEDILRKKLEQDATFSQLWENGCKVKKDPRITPMGRFLRRCSLDELPQILNVLRGEMSIIGPRPLPKYHEDQLPEEVRRLRRRVRPGMTGLWQVSGRSESGNEGIARWDAYYVRNWSIWLDVVILFRTFKAVICGTGAY